MGRADLTELDDANIGLAGSPTKIAKASDKVRKGAGEVVLWIRKSPLLTSWAN